MCPTIQFFKLYIYKSYIINTKLQIIRLLTILFIQRNLTVVKYEYTRCIFLVLLEKRKLSWEFFYMPPRTKIEYKMINCNILSVYPCNSLNVTSHNSNELLLIYFSITIFIKFFYHSPKFFITHVFTQFSGNTSQIPQAYFT